MLSPVPTPGGVPVGIVRALACGLVCAVQLAEDPVIRLGALRIGGGDIVVVIVPGIALVDRAAADAAWDDVQTVVGDAAVQIPLDPNLNDRRVLVGRGSVAAEGPVAHAVEDDAVVIDFDRLQTMGVRAVNQIGAGVDAGVREVDLIGVGLVIELLPPVEGTDHIFRTLFPQTADRSGGLVFAGVIVVIGGIDADAQTAGRGVEIRVVLSPVGDAIGLQRGQRVVQTVLPEVDTTLSAKDRRIGGLGIHIVRQFMDSINYERNSNLNILTIRKNLTIINKQ